MQDGYICNGPTVKEVENGSFSSSSTEILNIKGKSHEELTLGRISSLDPNEKYNDLLSTSNQENLILCYFNLQHNVKEDDESCSSSSDEENPDSENESDEELREFLELERLCSLEAEGNDNLPNSSEQVNAYICYLYLLNLHTYLFSF